VRRKGLPVALAMLCIGSPARAASAVAGGEDGAPLPLWEVGLGLGALAAPAYLGSSVTRRYLSPWPYLVYRGETFTANREGLGIDLLDTRRLKLDLSFSGILPVKSGGTARAGMPDLPLAVEAGALLRLALLDAPAGHLSLRLGMRHASGVNGHGIRNVGWIADPTLRWTQRLQGWGLPVDWGLDLTAKFQDRRYNDFYYQVAPAEATPTRPAYRSAGGYGGSTLNTGWLARRGPWGVGAFVGVSNLSGARFAASPLVEKKTNVFGGLTVFWVFRQSPEAARQRVPPDGGM